MVPVSVEKIWVQMKTVCKVRLERKTPPSGFRIQICIGANGAEGALLRAVQGCCFLPVSAF